MWYSGVNSEPWKCLSNERLELSKCQLSWKLVGARETGLLEEWMPKIVFLFETAFPAGQGTFSHFGPSFFSPHLRAMQTSSGIV